ncbi:MAG: tRNA pseudouridine(13) synthase TruD [bacterium]|nr:tRNA pseudouridine(13) synthase TruD [bacterium]
MNLKHDYKLRQQDEERIASFVSEDPTLGFAEDHPQFTPIYLNKIGIDYEPEVLGRAYIKLMWSDFIVEEITASNRIITIEPKEEEHFEQMNEEKPKTEADLVKQGMATFEVAEKLAEVLNSPISDISFAGLKDAKAITAQEISFNGLLPSDLAKVNISNMFLKNIHQRKGVVERGSLSGNRFTIHLRCDPVDQAELDKKIEEINKEGFYNFYSLQRFGTRMLTHETGLLVLQEKYDDAVKIFLVGQSPHELKVFQKIRMNAAQYWGNWDEMFNIFSRLPYFFYNELAMVEELKKSKGDFTKALSACQEQVRMAAYAYFSYWFNKLLSYLINNNLEIPETLPLLRPRDEIRELYKFVMPAEEMKLIKFHHPDLLFLSLNRLTDVPTKIKPHIWSATRTETGYVIHFDLDKGSYATTMLVEIFHLYQGKPVPDWVNQTKVDTRAMLGYEPVELTEMRFPGLSEDKVEVELE